MPTTSISLVREHTAAIRPPRALWVSFELGRPFGVPNDAGFQTEVLRAGLALLERDDGPVILEDYPKDAPAQAVEEEMEGLACPIPLPKPEIAANSDFERAILAEIGPLTPWYQMALESKERTLVGVSGNSIEENVRFLVDLLEGRADKSEDGDLSLGERMRTATEDVRTWYFEAAGARPGGAASSTALADWFWGETAAGSLFLKLHAPCSTSNDATLKEAAKSFLVPRAQAHRLASA